MWNANAPTVIGKEFPGGVIPDGLFRIPMEWFEAQGQSVAITGFDYTALDSLADQLRDLCSGSDDETIRRRFWRLYERVHREGTLDGLRLALGELDPRSGSDGLIMMAHNWWALMHLSGMSLVQNLSGPQIAAKLGISKQAFFQEVKRMSKRLQCRITRLNQRDFEARNHMRLRNYRSNGHATRHPRSKSSHHHQ